VTSVNAVVALRVVPGCRYPDRVILNLAAVCLMRGRTCLNVRKKGADHVILPGGKIEPGETPLEAATREAREETRLVLDPADLTHLGTFDAPAANRDADGIRCAVYLCNWRKAWPEPTPDSEIVEYEWTDLDHCHDDARQAPLLLDRVIPALQQQGLL
jgi:8-oxo-dGTP diphosphatase